MDSFARTQASAIRVLSMPQGSVFGIRAMEEEIASTLSIESIDYNRDSVRDILRGLAPRDEQESRIYGLRKGLDFISDVTKTITAKRIFELYSIAIADHIAVEDKLNPGEFYRHDTVFVVGQGIEHAGLPHGKLSVYMEQFVAFINSESQLDDLLKAAVIHFYFAYLHPYFDGNGRMARLLQMWYLRQRGYSSALFVPFSSYIERSRRDYYNAFSLIEENARISGVVDITPFVAYFIEKVYSRIEVLPVQQNVSEMFLTALNDGVITAKEKDLWNYVLSVYGNNEFSTKQLERDFGNAAYATIRGFVLKFTELELLTAQKYGSRMKYKIR
jgi:Fic family protein